jgi:RimK family alpha-L-glutamate ligase
VAQVKISIIDGRSDSWEAEALWQAAEKCGVEGEVTDLKDLNTLKAWQEKLGEVVIWRYASLMSAFWPAAWARSLVLDLLKDRLVINDVLGRELHWRSKMGQQLAMQQRGGIKTISTWHFARAEELVAALAAGQVKLPLVVKPNIGSLGKGVRKIERVEEIKQITEPFSKLVVQPYISHECDYRVLVVNGRVLGSMRRRPPAGDFRCNLAQGGQPERVEERETREKLKQLALRVWQATGLTFLGVDVLEQAETGELIFLEINSTPEWRGFQAVTGVPVAEEVIRASLELREKYARTA